MYVGVAILCNNESNEPQNVNKQDHVQESKIRIIIEAKNACGLG